MTKFPEFDGTQAELERGVDRRVFLQGVAASAAALALPKWASSAPAAADLDAIQKEIEKRHEKFRRV